MTQRLLVRAIWGKLQIANCKSQIARWMTIALILASPGVARTAETADQKPLEYSRYFVPDQPKDWPRRDVKYTPMARDEFERLIEVANSVPRGGSGSRTAQVSRAVYRAALAEKNVLRGDAQLQISRSVDRAVLIPIDPFGLALSKARWEDGTAATLGVSPSGKHALLVDRDGTLIVDWSLRGHRDAGGSLLFAIDLPASGVSRLELALPQSVVASSADAVVVSDDVQHRQGQWQFEAGGRSHISLKLDLDDAPSRAQPLVLLQEKTTYRLLPLGLEVTSQLKLDVHRDPLRRLQVELQPQLGAVSVQSGGVELPFSTTPAEPSEGTSVSVDFPEPLIGPGRVVTITMLAPLILDTTWKLPRIRVREATWQEGDIIVAVPAPLSLDSLLPQGCRQTKVSPANAASSGESVELQLFSADASAEIQVSRRRSKGMLISGTTLRFAADGVRAEFRGRFESFEGEAFLLRADVGSSWQIDSVTADRPDTLTSWAVDHAARPASLVLHLAKPVTAARPLELVIAGHRAPPADVRFSSTTLRLVDFHAVVSRRQLLALETSGNQRVSLQGTDGPRFEPRSQLSDAEQTLLASATSDVYLHFDPDRPNWNVVIDQQTPRYDGDLRVAVTASDLRLNESYHIRCQPEGSSVDHLLVAFSQARDDDPHFHLDQSAVALTAQRLSSGAQAARGLPPAGEVWLLELPKALDQPFSISAARSLTLSDGVMPALVSLPEAVSQQGTVEIESALKPPLIEAADRLEPVPSTSPKETQYASQRAVFRYDPLGELGDVTPPGVVLHTVPAAEAPTWATVWRLRLHSQYFSHEVSQHRAVLDLENHGEPLCKLRLPDQARLLGAEVDGIALPGLDNHGDLLLTLPRSRRFAVVSVEFELPESPLRLSTRYMAPWPKVDMLVQSREWFVSADSQYEPLLWSDVAGVGAAQLFGPFVRRSSETPFGATTPEDWRMLLGSQWQRAPRDGGVKRVLDALGAVLATSDPPVESFGRLLDEANVTQPSAFASFRIDARSLAAVDVGPESPLSSHSGPTTAADSKEIREVLATQALRSQGLAILVDREQLVLTSRTVARSLAGETFDDGRSLVFTRVQPQTNTDAVTADKSSSLPISVWRKTAQSAWRVNGNDADMGVSSAISNEYRIDSAQSTDLAVRLVRRDAVIAASVALFAIFTAGGAWLGGWRLTWLPILGGFSALAAVWLPPALVPLASGAVLGSIVAATWCLLRPTGRSAGSKATGPAVMRHPTTAVGVALLILVSGGSLAEEPQKEQATPVHRVFVPVDAQGKPSQTYQVPNDFLDELRRKASSASAEPRGWLVSDAAYQCTLDLEGPVGVREFIVRYKLHVLSSDARIRIPARRSQARLIVDSALLDGEPIELEWDEAGEAIECEITEAGIFELEFRLDPLIDDNTPWRGFRLFVPSVAGATLDVQLPTADLALDIPSALGETIFSSDGRRITCHLGPSGVIVVQWPAEGEESPEADIEELLWLKVRPGSVVLDVKLNYNVTSGRLRQLEFAADRRLRLLPSGHSFKERIPPAENSSPDAEQLIQLELERPVTDQESLALSFFVTGASGVGNIRLPRFHAVNGRVIRRWLAVTVDAGLEYESRDAEQLNALPAADFAAKWGEADAATLRDALVYRLPTADTAWHLATRSREPQTTVKEVLSLSLQRATALVRYDAQLMTTAGFVFQHRLRVPAELDIERVVLEEEGADRVARWSHTEDGLVTLFLSRRVTGPQQLMLWGRLPVRANGRLSLPTITLDDSPSAANIERAEILERSVYLYRKPSVNITLEDAVGLSEMPQSPSEQISAELGRLVFARTADPTYSGTVVVAVNSPHLRQALQITSLRYINQAWSTEIEYRFLADGGVVDEVAFDLPNALAAEVEILSPSAITELSDQPGKNRKVLVVRPLKPLSGECLVRLRAPLRYVPGEPVEAPDVIPLAASGTERYWLLPQQVGAESVTWDVQRMIATSFPEGATPPADAGGMAVYRAVGDHPQAVMNTVKAVSGIARVRLADVRIVYTPGEGWSGAAAIDLDPAGRSICTLKLATGWRLHQLNIGGTIAVPRPKSPGRWDVPLYSDRLPQRLEVTFSMSAKTTSPVLPLPIVEIDGWAVQENLFSVTVPPSYQVNVQAQQVDAATRDPASIASALALIDLADEIVATTSSDELGAWFRPWAHWLVAYAKRPDSQLSASRDSHTPSETILPEAWLRVARRLRVEHLLQQIVSEPVVVTDTMDLWQRTHETAPATCFRWTSAGGPTRLELRRSWSGGWFVRVHQSAWIVLLVLCAMALPRFSIVADAAHRWPYLLGVALAMLWWLFCQPGVFGLLLIALSLLASLRSAFRPLSQQSQQ
jgi:hypothetical protein